MVFVVFVLAVRAKGGFGSVVALNTGVCGAVLIVVEVVLVLVYQIMEGSVYKQMALIISFFMAGLAAGSALAGTLPGRRRARRLFMIQIGLAAYLGVLYLLFSVFRSFVLDSLGHDSMLLLFSALAFFAGMFGGGQFFAAVACSEKVRGAGLYAADLIGASAGAVAGSLFFLPVFGIPKTLLILAYVCLATSATLFNNRTGRGMKSGRSACAPDSRYLPAAPGAFALFQRNGSYAESCTRDYRLFAPRADGILRRVARNVADIDEVEALVFGLLPGCLQSGYGSRFDAFEFIQRVEPAEVKRYIRPQLIPDPPAHCGDLIDIVIFPWNHQIHYFGVNCPAASDISASPERVRRVPSVISR